MRAQSVSRWRWVALLALGACTSRANEGGQCSFNDDCESPLVCASRQCRIQCRTDRDCPTGQLCAPSDSPRKRVCIARTASALCGSDDACPAGSRCADNACWWRCSTDPECAARNAMTCMALERLCVTPVTVLQQRELGPELFTPGDGGAPRDASDDAAVDASTASDVVAPDSATLDVPALDVPALDVPVVSDVLVTPDVSPASDVTSAPDRVDVPPATCVAERDCFFANAMGRCASGLCALGACNPGFADCNGSATDGCEASTQTDVAHCGACARACNPAPNVATVSCVAGQCVRSVCAAGFGDCNGQASDGCETILASTTAHCGACGAACPDYTTAPYGALATVCAAGRCGYSMCASGRADCDGDATNGCEVDLLSSLAHCGACRSACTAGANSDAACTNLRCVRACRAGYGDCDADPANGCERDLQFDPEHCGACGARCSGSEVCAAGSCVSATYTANGATEVLAPTTDVTLTAGVHRYASVNIPAGVTVRVGAPGNLEIYARGEVRIDGTLDLSGGNGGDGTLASTTTCQGGNGSGGDTGTTLAGQPGAAMRRGVGGASGTGHEGGIGAGGFADDGGRNGGGAGGNPSGVGAGGGGGGWSGGGGGGGGSGCTFCGGGSGGGASGDSGNGGNGGSGGYPGLVAQGLEVYSGVAGTGSANTTPRGGGGGGGGCIGSGAAADAILVRDTFYPGSGGGGGGAPSGISSGVCVGTNANGGGGGGGGGGALRVASATRIVVGATGILRADGGRGGSGAINSATPSGGGGGGSGGAIHLWAPAVQVSGRVSAMGGAGGLTANAQGVGGGGGPGRIAVSANAPRCSLGGSFAPQLLNGCALSIGPGRVGVRAFP